MEKRIPSLDEFILNEEPQFKDVMRLDDILGKAKGDQNKQIQLATNMAKAITNPDKAMRRFEAAQEQLGDNHPVTKIFARRAKELGNPITINLEENVNEDKIGMHDTMFITKITSILNKQGIRSVFDKNDGTVIFKGTDDEQVKFKYYI